MEASSKGLANIWRDTGSCVSEVGEGRKPMGTTIAGAPVGGDSCGELFPKMAGTFLKQAVHLLEQKLVRAHHFERSAPA